MKIGELFVQLGVKGSTKELEKTIKQLEEAEKATRRQIKLQRKEQRKIRQKRKKASRKRSLFPESVCVFNKRRKVCYLFLIP